MRRGGLLAPYCTPEEFLAHPDAEGFVAPLLLASLLTEASAWCDGYVGTSLIAHRHVERRLMRPDSDGRLVWFPEHGPLISLESLTFGHATYTAPAVTLVDERSVVVDLKSTTASWVGSLQFGIPIMEMDTTWRYTAGYCTLPADVLRAVVLYGMSLVEPDPDLVIEAQRCLDPFRWTH